MPVDPAILADNEAQLYRLESLVARGPDLSQDLGGGWTVSVALAHLAFWDRRATYLLTHWKPGSPPAEVDDDMLNTSLFDEWRALPGEAAARLALDAARKVTGAAKSLNSHVADDIAAHGYKWLIHRANHRREHLDQIEAALSH